jgi:hypothetical protein
VPIGVFISYAQWDRASDHERTMYIAGAIDSLLAFGTPDTQRTSLHYSQCIRNSQMNAEQISKNVRAFASTQPALQAQTVQGALGSYLAELCGLPPQK